MYYWQGFIYEFRISLGWFFWIPAFWIVPILASVTFLQVGVSERDLSIVFNTWLPILLGIMAAPLMSREKNLAFYEVRNTYVESALRIPIQRTLLCILYLIILWIVTLLCFRLSYGDFHLSILFSPIVPALYLASVSLFVDNISGNGFISAITVVIYGWFEYQTQGSYTGVVYLFNDSLSNGSDPSLNRILLISASLVLLISNIVVNLSRKPASRR